MFFLPISLALFLLLILLLPILLILIQVGVVGIVSAVLALLCSPSNPAPVAYIAGVTGTLIGVDLLNLNLPERMGREVDIHRSSRGLRWNLPGPDYSR